MLKSFLKKIKKSSDVENQAVNRSNKSPISEISCIEGLSIRITSRNFVENMGTIAEIAEARPTNIPIKLFVESKKSFFIKNSKLIVKYRY